MADVITTATTDVPPGTTLNYKNVQGSNIIAALSSSGEWKVLCINSNKHVHVFTWTQEDLIFDYNLGRDE